MGMRSFDPVRVGELECDAWVTYYRRNWVGVLRAALALTRESFGLSWPETLRGGWWVLRANQLWAPYPDNDPDGARRYMERFYRMIAAREGASFEPAEAARREVEWWRAHRELQHGRADGDDGELVEALVQLYAYVYSVPPDSVRSAARERALAMLHSDRWIDDGCDPSSPLIAEERAALVGSYRFLLAAVRTDEATSRE
ncbi:MAG TPA: hypothetical protein VFY30_09270 [Solirubrobacterales bacterium]|nr:hypothetical protein [Solirubrobacterales bacterium]